MTTFITPQGLKNSEAIAYVGGKPVWQDLMKHYGDKLTPFRRTAQRDCSYYRRDLIDKILLLAEVEGTMVEPAPKKLPNRPVGKHPTRPPADSPDSD